MEKLIINMKMHQAKKAANMLFPNEQWLQKEEWGKRIFVSSRRKIGVKTNFKNELRDAQILRDFGSTVYLVPEIKTLPGEKKYDAIVDGLQMEFKNMSGNNCKTLIDHFYRSRKQAPNVFINLEKSSLTKQKILKSLYRARNSDEYSLKNQKYIGGIIIIKVHGLNYLLYLNIDNLELHK